MDPMCLPAAPFSSPLPVRAGVDTLPAAVHCGGGRAPGGDAQRVGVLPAASSSGDQRRAASHELPEARSGAHDGRYLDEIRAGATAERSAGIWFLEQVASAGDDQIPPHAGPVRTLDESRRTAGAQRVCALLWPCLSPFAPRQYSRAPVVAPTVVVVAPLQLVHSPTRLWPRAPSLPTCSTLARILRPASPPSISSRTFPATCALPTSSGGALAPAFTEASPHPR
jgi:hypothetical protein